MPSPISLVVDVQPKTYLLTIRGKVASASIEESRQTHNAVAGTDAGIAAARSLGDLSHVVFVPLGTTSSTEEIMFLDQWNSLPGLMQFFGNAQVQQGGGKMFASKEPVVWEIADGFPRFAMPAPAGRNERYLGMVRGVVRSKEGARAAFEAVSKQTLNTARARGLVSREYYLRVPEPGTSPTLELLGFDTWHNVEGMKEHYGSGVDMEYLKDVFAARPDTSIWQRPAGSWIEW